jgi:hypothetical protein
MSDAAAKAVEGLSRSSRGLQALRGLQRLFAENESEILGLDQRNQEAVILLVREVFVKPMSTRELICDAIDPA